MAAVPDVIKTDRNLTAFRIGDPDGAYPIFDAEGARIAPGRWNTARSPVIYTSEHYSTAMLEKIVHLGSELPPNQHYIRIAIPKGTTIEIFDPAANPGWDSGNSKSRRYGQSWFTERRSLILAVPASQPFANVLETDENGYLVTQGVTTKLPGVFVAGDIADSRYRQAVTAAGQGCRAAIEAMHYLERANA